MLQKLISLLLYPGSPIYKTLHEKYHLDSYFIKKKLGGGKTHIFERKFSSSIINNFFAFLFVGFFPEGYIRVLWLWHLGGNAKKCSNLGKLLATESTFPARKEISQKQQVPFFFFFCTVVSIK